MSNPIFYRNPVQSKSSFFPSTNQIAPLPQQKTHYTKCSVTNKDLLGVLRSTGSYLYEFNPFQNKPVPHICQCQLKTTEYDLKPLYSQKSEVLLKEVIFMYNNSSNNIEQYICLDDSRQFEQVEKTGLSFHPSRQIMSNGVVVFKNDKEDEMLTIEKDSNGYVQKMMYSKGKSSYLHPLEVKTLISKKVQKMKIPKEPEDVEKDDVISEYEKYINSLPKFVVTRYRSNEVIYAFNESSLTFETFTYNERLGIFEPFSCISCPKSLMEYTQVIRELSVWVKYGSRTVEIGT